MRKVYGDKFRCFFKKIKSRKKTPFFDKETRALKIPLIFNALEKPSEGNSPSDIAG
jgi:hypothetical protein